MRFHLMGGLLLPSGIECRTATPMVFEKTDTYVPNTCQSYRRGRKGHQGALLERLDAYLRASVLQPTRSVNTSSLRSILCQTSSGIYRLRQQGAPIMILYMRWSVSANDLKRP
ncbi:uncharacterized protein F4812DRAFT_172755 [Daldinia caldariorum]|uniref:uncharacterized protein n=1 Tax=Daldinia caldariorum TaxID=326644 RepID=UPI0020089968|nr:uncharacterized protein F4812DRAFT_172755 [Daldinia caldariorum]KAI1471298.1 hypothetical protein F4812DRAFT_172755 [Daldinia caldariorum]